MKASVVVARRWVAFGTALAVVATVLAGPSPVRAADTPAAPGSHREAVVQAWETGGQVVRDAAQRALLGSDADVESFLEAWPRLKVVDDRISVNRVMSSGGPAVRQVAQAALDSTDPNALSEFLVSGWQTAMHSDQRLHVNQIMNSGGTSLKAAAQKALDADAAQANVPVGDPAGVDPDDPSTVPSSSDSAALETFIGSGWQNAFATDQRIRVNQILSSGGQEVKKAAQQALDANNVEALTAFIDSGWAVAAARDQEATTIGDLVASAKSASDEAVRQNEIAKDQAAKATRAADAAKQAAQEAADAVDRAKQDAAAAAAAAKRAEQAATNAAEAAAEAVSASRVAVAAAQVAASAAARASSAALLTQKAANRARKAAADAATDAGKAQAAKDAAKSARDIALVTKTVADAAAAADTVAREAGNAVTAAGNAVTDADKAVAATQEALERARQTGVNVDQALAAARRARSAAARSNRAAKACAKYAAAAASAAHTAGDAAKRAVDDANAAAAAAEEAAKHAGEAAQAAQRSTDAANAATTAANDAVTAVNEAQKVYDAAREVEAERLAVLTDQGEEAAQAAMAQLQKYQQKTRWDAQEAAKRSGETARLIAEVRSPQTPRATAVADARKVALALSNSNGSWTRQAAVTALGESDDFVLEYVRTGVDVAAAQDDRATVTVLAATRSEAFGKAAETALAGTDADVTQFLKTQAYPERATEDRLAVNQVQSAARTNGDTATVDAAQRALDAHDDNALRDFLATGQYTAADTDERLKVNRILSDANSGPELKAAAQIALDGPPAALHSFLTRGRYTAEQNDANAASHAAEMRALLAQGAAAAKVALQKAQEAQAVAAKARGRSDEALAWSDKATQSSREATALAQQAIDSANDAQRSADKAAASARTAATAAAQADQAANSAAHSAAWALDSYDRAQNAASQARAAAKSALDSAKAAGKDAATAIGYYNEAYDNITKVAEQQRKEQNARQMSLCQAESLPGSAAFANCMHHVTDSDSLKLGKAIVNGEMCQKMARQGSAYYQNCLADTFNPNFMTNRSLDMIQGYVTVLQSIATVGGVALGAIVTALLCNVACAAVGGIFGGAEVIEGIGGLYMLWQEAALIDLAVGGSAGSLVGERTWSTLTKMAGLRLPAVFERLTAEDQAEQAIMQRLATNFRECLGNSFAPQTPVLLADGSRKAIRDVRVGDQVLAADPERELVKAEPVIAVHQNLDQDLADVTVLAAGGRATIQTTGQHPFWDETDQGWVPAVGLEAKDELRTADGTTASVEAVDPQPGAREMHNLTVAEIHTFFVFAGETPVLVHNCNDLRADALAFPREAHTLSEHVGLSLEEATALAKKKSKDTGKDVDNGVFYDEQTAQQVVDYAIAFNRDRINKWLKSGESKLLWRGTFGVKRPLGWTVGKNGIPRATGNGYVIMLQRADGHRNKFIVYTCYPV